MIDSIAYSHVYDIPIRGDNQGFLDDSKNVKAHRGTRDYADVQPAYMHYESKGNTSAVSQAISKRYDKLFDLYIASEPGSLRARRLLSALKNAPTC